MASFRIFCSSTCLFHLIHIAWTSFPTSTYRPPHPSLKLLESLPLNNRRGLGRERRRGRKRKRDSAPHMSTCLLTCSLSLLPRELPHMLPCQLRSHLLAPSQKLPPALSWLNPADFLLSLLDISEPSDASFPVLPHSPHLQNLPQSIFL